MGSIVKRGHPATRPVKLKESSNHIKSIVYGGLDGTITTFAIVAGITGAALSPGVVFVLGLANLIADGISMAAGDFLSTRAEQDLETASKNKENNGTIKLEKDKLVDLYQENGLSKKDAHIVVSIFAKKRELLTKIVLREKDHMVASEESPVQNGLMTFVSFIFFGFIPLTIYVAATIIGTEITHTFAIASILTIGTLFGLGALRANLTSKPWHLAGLETVIIGGAAALAAYLVGFGLSSFA